MSAQPVYASERGLVLGPPDNRATALEPRCPLARVRYTMQRSVLPLALALAACGYTDGGGGTRTLEVVAELEYETEDNRMEIRIRVEKEGIPVDSAENGGTAVVRVTDDETDEIYPIPQPSVGGEFFDEIESYHRRMKLLVESGSDRVEGQLEGPGKHRVVHPENDSVLQRADLDDEVNVEWDTEDGIAAQEVTIRINRSGFTHTIRDYEDPGHYAVPRDRFQDGDDDVRVIRTNKVRLDGGVGESRLEIQYEARNRFVIE